MNKKQSNRVIYEFVYTLKIYSVCYMFFCGIIVLRFVESGLYRIVRPIIKVLFMFLFTPMIVGRGVITKSGRIVY